VTGAALVHADALAVPLADESVDLIVTSPPYFALRSYRDDGDHYHGQIGSEPSPGDFLAALWAVTAECKRILKPHGSLWVNLGDKYAGSGGHNNSGLNTDYYYKGHNWDATRNAPKSYNKNAAVGDGSVRNKSLMGLPWRYALGCIDQLGMILRAEIIWSKPNGLPESVTDRVRRSHEQWFHLVKEPRYFAAVDELREPHAPKTLTHRGGGQAQGNTRNPDNNFGSDKPRVVDPLGRLPGSVWTVPSEPLKVPEWLGVDHFAAFPQEIPRRLILGWSPPGICTACGEGRRPVVAKGQVRQATRSDESQAFAAGASKQGRSGFTRDVTWMGSNEATITGYACACDVTLAPTRPAVVLDPFGGTGTVAMTARALGRYGINIDLSADYLRLARWRIFESRAAAKTITRTDRERQGTLL
jgi:DNA modification methylase